MGKAKGKKAEVGPKARVTGDAVVRDEARVLDTAHVSGRSQVRDHACVKDHARLAGQAEVAEHAVVGGNAWVYDNALVKGSAQIGDHVRVFGDAIVSGNARIEGQANVGPRARIKHTDHVVTYSRKSLTVKNVDPRATNGPDVWTAYRTRKDGVRVLRGRTPEKVSNAPKELLKQVTWAKV